MARPLRIDVKDGWYHITARGIERRAIFRDKRDYGHFLELVGEMAERSGVKVHVYALMGNHYHLLIQTPEANASRAIQWLNVSYSVWFNLRHNRVGHVFQGRFGSVLVDDSGSWAQLESVYIHLNPVRLKRLGLDKGGREAEGKGFKEASASEIKERLEVLRSYEWSSYRAYAGYAAKPEWLTTEDILRRGGGREEYRRYVESYIRQGREEELVEKLRARVVIGATGFVEKSKRLLKKISREQPDRRVFSARIDFNEIVSVVEKISGEKWKDFAERYGNHLRDMVLYIARKRSGLTLPAIGEKAGGLDYKTVGKAVGRFQVRLGKDQNIRRQLGKCESQLSIVDGVLPKSIFF